MRDSDMTRHISNNSSILDGHEAIFFFFRHLVGLSGLEEDERLKLVGLEFLRKDRYLE